MTDPIVETDLGHDPDDFFTLCYLAGVGVRYRRFVGKNVCHTLLYDRAFHATMPPADPDRPATVLFMAGMGRTSSTMRRRSGTTRRRRPATCIRRSAPGSAAG